MWVGVGAVCGICTCVGAHGRGQSRTPHFCLFFFWNWKPWYGLLLKLASKQQPSSCLHTDNRVRVSGVLMPHLLICMAAGNLNSGLHTGIESSFRTVTSWVDVDYSLFQLNDVYNCMFSLWRHQKNGQEFHCSILYMTQIYFLSASPVATQRQKRWREMPGDTVISLLAFLACPAQMLHRLRSLFVKFRALDNMMEYQVSSLQESNKNNYFYLENNIV